MPGSRQGAGGGWVMVRCVCVRLGLGFVAGLSSHASPGRVWAARGWTPGFIGSFGSLLHIQQTQDSGMEATVYDLLPCFTTSGCGSHYLPFCLSLVSFDWDCKCNIRFDEITRCLGIQLCINSAMQRHNGMFIDYNMDSWIKSVAQRTSVFIAR